MVVETRYRAGRGARKGRGVENHQRVFRDHIKHMNEVRMFEKRLKGNQEVKIKQEIVDETVGNKYTEIEATPVDRNSNKGRKISSVIRDILDNASLQGREKQPNELIVRKTR